MPERRRPFLYSLVWMLLSLLVPAVRPCFAEVRSIQDFLKFEDRWSEFVGVDYQWQLEGRYAGISDGRLTFTKCPLPFLVTEDQFRDRGNTGVIEVSGQIVREGKGLAFRVSSLSSRPRDIDRLKNMRFAIDSTKPNDWYRAAEWARARGTFYGDQDLLKESQDLDRNGFLTELRQLNIADEQGFVTLMERARAKKLDDALLQQIQHDFLQAQAVRIRNRPDPAAYREFSVRIQRELPGAGTPLKNIPQSLNEKYLKDPKTVYAEAGADERRILDRLFAIQIAAERIERQAAADGANGFEIAGLLRQAVPERADLIQKYEALAVRHRFQNINVLTQAELLEFSSWLESRQRTEEAIDAKKKWLSSREPLYRQEGARGLADLGQLWMTLLRDVPAAAQFYIEAWQENPQYTPASDWLTAHGYRRFEKSWLPEEDLPEMPLSPRELAIREGRVEVGMTAPQVQAALGTLPNSITRIASRSQVTEWWTYEGPGIVIELVKLKRDPQSSVVKIEQLNTVEARAEEK